MSAYSAKQHHGDEAKLALGLRQHLAQQGYTTYPELDRVDLVARKGDEVLAIECKRVADLKVFAQAWQHRKRATGIYVAIPAKDLYGQDSWGVSHFIGDLCRRMGIGCYTVGWNYAERAAWGAWKPGEPQPTAKVTLQYPSAGYPRTDTSWDALMVPAGEDYSVAGGSGVKAWTRTRIWELEVKTWVHENPGKTVGEILGALRPPGVHKKTGKPLVVRKQDKEILFYHIKNIFTDFHVRAAGTDFSTSRIFLYADYEKAMQAGGFQ